MQVRCLLGPKSYSPAGGGLFGGKSELRTGQLEAGKAALGGQKSARIRCRLGFAGYKVRSKAHADIS